MTATGIHLNFAAKLSNEVGPPQYNIHALREQWDYYTIASKLARVIELYEFEHEETPNEKQLSEATGLTRGQIRRCRLLLNLPKKYKSMLLLELDLLKIKQKLSEDFFIEMERSLKTVTRRFPEYEGRLNDIRDTLIVKYRHDTIGAVTDFRQMSKIATAVDKLDIARTIAKKSLDRVFDAQDSTGIREACENTVEFSYDERKAGLQVQALIDYFDDVFETGEDHDLDEDFLSQLNELYKRLKKLLGK